MQSPSALDNGMDQVAMVVGQTRPVHVVQESGAENSESEETQRDIKGRHATSANSEESQAQSPSASISSNGVPGQNRSESNKRKAEKLAVRDYRSKKLKGLYNNDYRHVLNSTIRDTVQNHVQTADPLPPSQMGVSLWTSAEKELFFAALPSLGKDNVRGIATRIGTKSALEVQEYIRLLHQGMVEKNLTEPRQQLLGLTDVPAAMQISEECCEVLERSADALALRQERHEENVEKTKWGESWLLTYGVTDWVEEHFREESGIHALRETLPAAELLNLGNWLEISTRIFMNPASPRELENWQNMIEPGEEPGIRATAFTDFHTLAISLTKRLVSATLFCAMSRLRSMDSPFFHNQESVKRADVHAAARTLGLQLDSKKFWMGCARRCNLDVHQKLTTTAAASSAMNYDEVEKILSNFTKPGHRSSASTNNPNVPEYAPESVSESEESVEESIVPSEQDDQSESENEGHPDAEDFSFLQINRNLASEYMNDIHNGPLDPSDSEFENPKIHADRIQQKSRHKEAEAASLQRYLDAIDIKASLVEEKRLWNLLKQHPPFAIRPEEIDIPARPWHSRKEGEDLVDWRERIEYWSEWEVFEKPVPPSAFAAIAKRRKGSQLDRVAKQSDAGVESDMDDANSADDSISLNSELSAHEHGGNRNSERTPRSKVLYTKTPAGDMKSREDPNSSESASEYNTEGS